ncbi:MAG: hypothetical protein QM669_12440 [Siphonobacter sp.]
MKSSTVESQSIKFMDEFDCANPRCRARQIVQVTDNHKRACANCVVCQKVIKTTLIHSGLTTS